MKKHSLLTIILIILAAVFMLTGCSSGNTAQETDAKPLAQPSSADPKGALEEIYKDCDIKDIGPADDNEVSDVLGLNLDNIFSYNIMYSKGNYGIKDTYIIRPMPDQMGEVKSQLESRQDAMIRQYERYDIYGAYEISQNGLIYEQGDYIIMLMHEDNEAVRAIIDQYIPSK